MPATYDKIAVQTASSNTSILFSSIPATYTDLVLIVAIQGSGPQYMGYRFNGDTGSNYSFTTLSADGSTASSSRQTNANGMNTGLLLSSYPYNELQIMSYANTNVLKSCLSKRGDTSFGVNIYAGYWGSFSAINSVTVYSPNPFSGTLSLYGIKAA